MPRSSPRQTTRTTSTVSRQVRRLTLHGIASLVSVSNSYLFRILGSHQGMHVDIGMHAVTRQEVEAMGKNASEGVRTQPDWGYKPDTYIAEIDVFHQLHCLNALRQTNILYYDYYWGQEFGYEPPVLFESHINHCLDILRQNIMCNANVEMLTYNWRLTQHNPFPDIGAVKVCRDFEAIVKWQQEVELKDEPAKWAKIVKEADAVDLPMPKHLDELEVTSYSPKGLMLKKLTGITPTPPGEYQSSRGRPPGEEGGSKQHHQHRREKGRA